MTTVLPPRSMPAAWAHPPAPTMISTRGRAVLGGTPSSRTARTAPSVRRAGIPRCRRSSARAGKESEETISALNGMVARAGREPGRPSWPRSGPETGPSRRLLDRIGCDGGTAPLADRLGRGARRLSGRLGPLLRVLAGGKGRGVPTLHQGGHLVTVEHLVLQQRLGHAHQSVSVLFHHLLRAVVGVQADSLDLLVDQHGGRLAVVLVLGDLATQEALFFLLSKCEW